MARRTPAEAAIAAVERLLKMRRTAQAKLEAIDAEIAELHAALGVPLVIPAPAAVPGRPLMAGERQQVDPNAPKKTLAQLMQEAAANPAPPGPTPEERPPFQELTQDAILTKDGLENAAPSDNMGAGRWM